MSGYHLSTTCRADIDAIWDYIAAHNPDAADRIVESLLNRFHRLGLQPGIGARYPALGEGVRFSVVGSYVILYLAGDDEVQIQRVLHGSRDIPKVYASEPIEP